MHISKLTLIQSKPVCFYPIAITDHCQHVSADVCFVSVCLINLPLVPIWYGVILHVNWDMPLSVSSELEY